MPDPKRYTVRDPESGRTITFAWSGDAPPTDDEIGEVFAAAPSGPTPTGEPPAPRHPLAQFSNKVGDFVTGAGKELAEQGIRGGQVLRKIPGVGLLDHLMKPIEVNTQPTNETQRLGGVALNAAEVMAPTKALTSLGLKVLPRVAAQGATGAGTAALQGKSPIAGAAASMAPTAVLGAAHKAGPLIANNAPAISMAASQLPGIGIGAGFAGGRPIAGMLSSAASAVATNPRVIRGAGNLAAKIGESHTAEASEAAFRAALLQALAEEPASTVP